MCNCTSCVWRSLPFGAAREMVQTVQGTRPPSQMVCKARDSSGGAGGRQVAEIAIVLVNDTAHAVRPWRGVFQGKSENFLHLLSGVGIRRVREQLVGDCADHLMTLIVPGEGRCTGGNGEQ